jgi:hypothetical protein
MAFTEEQRAQLTGLLQQGELTREAIAAQVGVSPGTE